MRRKRAWDWEPTATIPADAQTGVYSWEGQAAQYPPTGVPGISYFAGEVPNGKPVNCLLYRDEHGELVGILNHYDDTYWSGGILPYILEVPGNVNMWVKPSERRKGIGTALLEEAERRYGPLELHQQRYTEAGAAFVKALLLKRRTNG